MRVASLNFSDAHGGAARAAHCIHNSLRDINVSSEMIVSDKNSDDCSIIGPSSSLIKTWLKFRPRLLSPLRKSLQTYPSAILSPAILPSTLPRRINNSDFDLVHMHWINYEMLSISDISNISRPIIWTFMTCGRSVVLSIIQMIFDGVSAIQQLIDLHMSRV